MCSDVCVVAAVCVCVVAVSLGSVGVRGTVRGWVCGWVCCGYVCVGVQQYLGAAIDEMHSSWESILIELDAKLASFTTADSEVRLVRAHTT